MTRNQIDYQKHVEDVRSNRANEALKAEQNREQIRSNQANEGLQRGRNVETSRSNLANEMIASARQREDARHNYAMEILQASANAELARSNLARELENSAHNREIERLQQQGDIMRYNSALQGYETQRYSADIAAASRKYATDVQASTSSTNAALDRQAQMNRLAKDLEAKAALEHYKQRVQTLREYGPPTPREMFKEGSSVISGLGKALLNKR